MNWDSKLIINYRLASSSALWNKWSFQATGEYQSPEVVPQGKRKEMYGVDFGLRKEFLKNKATFVFNINDIFNSRKRGTIYDTQNYYQDAYRRWDVRNFRVSFTYRFGKADFQLFKKNNKGGDNDNNGMDRGD
jgi:hypothetical protein